MQHPDPQGGQVAAPNNFAAVRAAATSNCSGTNTFLDSEYVREGAVFLNADSQQQASGHQQLPLSTPTSVRLHHNNNNDSSSTPTITTIEQAHTTIDSIATITAAAPPTSKGVRATVGAAAAGHCAPHTYVIMYGTAATNTITTVMKGGLNATTLTEMPNRQRAEDEDGQQQQGTNDTIKSVNNNNSTNSCNNNGLLGGGATNNTSGYAKTEAQMPFSLSSTARQAEGNSPSHVTVPAAKDGDDVTMGGESEHAAGSPDGDGGEIRASSSAIADADAVLLPQLTRGQQSRVKEILRQLRKDYPALKISENVLKDHVLEAATRGMSLSMVPIEPEVLQQMLGIQAQVAAAHTLAASASVLGGGEGGADVLINNNNNNNTNNNNTNNANNNPLLRDQFEAIFSILFREVAKNKREHRGGLSKRRWLRRQQGHEEGEEYDDEIGDAAGEGGGGGETEAAAARRALRQQRAEEEVGKIVAAVTRASADLQFSTLQSLQSGQQAQRNNNNSINNTNTNPTMDASLSADGTTNSTTNCWFRPSSQLLPSLRSSMPAGSVVSYAATSTKSKSGHGAQGVVPTTTITTMPSSHAPSATTAPSPTANTTAEGGDEENSGNMVTITLRDDGTVEAIFEPREGEAPNSQRGNTMGEGGGKRSKRRKKKAAAATAAAAAAVNDAANTQSNLFTLTTGEDNEEVEDGRGDGEALVSDLLLDEEEVSNQANYHPAAHYQQQQLQQKGKGNALMPPSAVGGDEIDSDMYHVADQQDHTQRMSDGNKKTASDETRASSALVPRPPMPLTPNGNNNSNSHKNGIVNFNPTTVTATATTVVLPQEVLRMAPPMTLLYPADYTTVVNGANTNTNKDKDKKETAAVGGSNSANASAPIIDGNTINATTRMPLPPPPLPKPPLPMPPFSPYPPHMMGGGAAPHNMYYVGAAVGPPRFGFPYGPLPPPPGVAATMGNGVGAAPPFMMMGPPPPLPPFGSGAVPKTITTASTIGGKLNPSSAPWRPPPSASPPPPTPATATTAAGGAAVLPTPPPNASAPHNNNAHNPSSNGPATIDGGAAIRVEGSTAKMNTDNNTNPPHPTLANLPPPPVPLPHPSTMFMMPPTTATAAGRGGGGGYLTGMGQGLGGGMLLSSPPPSSSTNVLLQIPPPPSKRPLEKFASLSSTTTSDSTNPNNSHSGMSMSAGAAVGTVDDYGSAGGREVGTDYLPSYSSYSVTYNNRPVPMLFAPSPPQAQTYNALDSKRSVTDHQHYRSNNKGSISSAASKATMLAATALAQLTPSLANANVSSNGVEQQQQQPHSPQTVNGRLPSIPLSRSSGRVMMGVHNNSNSTHHNSGHSSRPLSNENVVVGVGYGGYRGNNNSSNILLPEDNSRGRGGDMAEEEEDEEEEDPNRKEQEEQVMRDKIISSINASLAGVTVLNNKNNNNSDGGDNNDGQEGEMGDDGGSLAANPDGLTAAAGVVTGSVCGGHSPSLHAVSTLSPSTDVASLVAVVNGSSPAPSANVSPLGPLVVGTYGNSNTYNATTTMEGMGGSLSQQVDQIIVDDSGAEGDHTRKAKAVEGGAPISIFEAANGKKPLVGTAVQSGGLGLLPHTLSNTNNTHTNNASPPFLKKDDDATDDGATSNSAQRVSTSLALTTPSHRYHENDDDQQQQQISVAGLKLLLDSLLPVGTDLNIAPPTYMSVDTLHNTHRFVPQIPKDRAADYANLVHLANGGGSADSAVVTAAPSKGGLLPLPAGLASSTSSSTVAAGVEASRRSGGRVAYAGDNNTNTNNTVREDKELVDSTVLSSNSSSSAAASSSTEGEDGSNSNSGRETTTTTEEDEDDGRSRSSSISYSYYSSNQESKAFMFSGYRSPSASIPASVGGEAVAQRKQKKNKKRDESKKKNTEKKGKRKKDKSASASIVRESATREARAEVETSAVTEERQDARGNNDNEKLNTEDDTRSKRGEKATTTVTLKKEAVDDGDSQQSEVTAVVSKVSSMEMEKREGVPKGGAAEGRDDASSSELLGSHTTSPTPTPAHVAAGTLSDDFAESLRGGGSANNGKNTVTMATKREEEKEEGEGVIDTAVGKQHEERSGAGEASPPLPPSSSSFSSSSGVLPPSSNASSKPHQNQHGSSSSTATAQKMVMTASALRDTFNAIAGNKGLMIRFRREGGCLYADSVSLSFATLSAAAATATVSSTAAATTAKADDNARASSTSSPSCKQTQPSQDSIHNTATTATCTLKSATKEVDGEDAGASNDDDRDGSAATATAATTPATNAKEKPNTQFAAASGANAPSPTSVAAAANALRCLAIGSLRGAGSGGGVVAGGGHGRGRMLLTSTSNTMGAARRLTPAELLVRFSAAAASSSLRQSQRLLTCSSSFSNNNNNNFDSSAPKKDESLSDNNTNSNDGMCYAIDDFVSRSDVATNKCLVAAALAIATAAAASSPSSPSIFVTDPQQARDEGLLAKALVTIREGLFGGVRGGGAGGGRARRDASRGALLDDDANGDNDVEHTTTAAAGPQRLTLKSLAAHDRSFGDKVDGVYTNDESEGQEETLLSFPPPVSSASPQSQGATSTRLTIGAHNIVDAEVGVAGAAPQTQMQNNNNNNNSTINTKNISNGFSQVVRWKIQATGGGGIHDNDEDINGFGDGGHLSGQGQFDLIIGGDMPIIYAAPVTTTTSTPNATTGDIRGAGIVNEKRSETVLVASANANTNALPRKSRRPIDDIDEDHNGDDAYNNNKVTVDIGVDLDETVARGRVRAREALLDEMLVPIAPYTPQKPHNTTTPTKTNHNNKTDVDTNGDTDLEGDSVVDGAAAAADQPKTPIPPSPALSFVSLASAASTHLSSEAPRLTDVLTPNDVERVVLEHFTTQQRIHLAIDSVLEGPRKHDGGLGETAFKRKQNNNELDREGLTMASLFGMGGGGLGGGQLALAPTASSPTALMATGGTSSRNYLHQIQQHQQQMLWQGYNYYLCSSSSSAATSATFRAVREWQSQIELQQKLFHLLSTGEAPPAAGAEAASGSYYRYDDHHPSPFLAAGKQQHDDNNNNGTITAGTTAASGPFLPKVSSSSSRGSLVPTSGGGGAVVGHQVVGKGSTLLLALKNIAQEVAAVAKTRQESDAHTDSESEEKKATTLTTGRTTSGVGNTDTNNTTAGIDHYEGVEKSAAAAATDAAPKISDGPLPTQTSLTSTTTAITTVTGSANNNNNTTSPHCVSWTRHKAPEGFSASRLSSLSVLGQHSRANVNGSSGNNLLTTVAANGLSSAPTTTTSSSTLGVSAVEIGMNSRLAAAAGGGVVALASSSSHHHHHINGVGPSAAAHVNTALASPSSFSLSTTEALSMWFDTVVANTGHVGLVLHNDGIVRNVEVLKSSDLLSKIPGGVGVALAQDSMQGMQQIFRWIVSECSVDGEYVLFRRDGDADFEIYEITPTTTTAGANNNNKNHQQQNATSRDFATASSTTASVSASASTTTKKSKSSRNGRPNRRGKGRLRRKEELKLQQQLLALQEQQEQEREQSLGQGHHQEVGGDGGVDTRKNGEDNDKEYKDGSNVDSSERLVEVDEKNEREEGVIADEGENKPSAATSDMDLAVSGHHVMPRQTEGVEDKEEGGVESDVMIQKITDDLLPPSVVDLPLIAQISHEDLPHRVDEAAAVTAIAAAVGSSRSLSTDTLPCMKVNNADYEELNVLGQQTVAGALPRNAAATITASLAEESIHKGQAGEGKADHAAHQGTEDDEKLTQGETETRIRTMEGTHACGNSNIAVNTNESGNTITCTDIIASFASSSSSSPAAPLAVSAASVGTSSSPSSSHCSPSQLSSSACPCPSADPSSTCGDIASNTAPTTTATIATTMTSHGAADCTPTQLLSSSCCAKKRRTIGIVGGVGVEKVAARLALGVGEEVEEGISVLPLPPPPSSTCTMTDATSHGDTVERLSSTANLPPSSTSSTPPPTPTPTPTPTPPPASCPFGSSFSSAVVEPHQLVQRARCECAKAIAHRKAIIEEGERRAKEEAEEARRKEGLEAYKVHRDLQRAALAEVSSGGSRVGLRGAAAGGVIETTNPKAK